MGRPEAVGVALWGGQCRNGLVRLELEAWSLDSGLWRLEFCGLRQLPIAVCTLPNNLGLEGFTLKRIGGNVE